MRAGKELKTTRLALLLSVKTVAAPQYYAHVVTSPYPSLFVRPRRSSVAGMRLEDGGALKVDNEQTLEYRQISCPVLKKIIQQSRCGLQCFCYPGST